MINEAVATRMQQITDAARSCVIPLYTSEGRRRGFLHVGTAVLIRALDGRSVAVTAGHILDNIAPLPLLTRGMRESALIRLRYDTALTSQPSRPNRDRDTVDVAAFELDATTTADLLATGASFLAEDSIRHDWNPVGIYVAVGFPSSRNAVKRRLDVRNFTTASVPATQPRVKPYVIPSVAVFAPCEAARDEQYERVKADLELNFVVTFRHQALRDAEGNVYPHPRGMSGGAIYRIGTGDTLMRASETQLAAVSTAYHETLGLLVGASAPAVRRVVNAIKGVQDAADKKT